MAEEGFISEDAARRTSSEPIQVVQRALEAQAPYFVDYVGQSLAEQYPGVDAGDGAAQRLHDARPPSAAAGAGCAAQRADARRRAAVAPQAAAPRRGRAHRRSTRAPAKCWRWSAAAPTTSRSTTARSARGASPDRSSSRSSTWPPSSARPPKAAPISRPPRSSTTRRRRLPPVSRRSWTPNNYEDEYDGLVTLRRALALSRNVATIKVAETTGFDRVAALWRRLGVGTTPHAYPSITLGVFEATPLEIATAYTIFPNGGVIRPLRVLSRVVVGSESRVPPDAPTKTRRAGRHDLSGHEHDAQRDQRRHRRRRARRRLRARRRRENRHDERSARRAGSSASRPSC